MKSDTSFETNAREHIASRGSKDTRKLYTADLETWLTFCTERGHNVESPSLEAATAWRDALADGRLAASTVRRTLSAVCAMYDAHGVPSNPFKSKRLARPPADEVAVTESFTKEQAEALLSAAEKSSVGLRDYTIVRALYDTGMRVSTVCGMRRDALRERDGGLFLITTVKKKGRVEIALPEKTAEAISAWLRVAPESQWVFPAARGKGSVTRKAIHRRISEFGRAVGIIKAKPHRFRATYITEALDAGVPLNEVQASVHHASPLTTQRYDDRVRGGGVADAVAKFREKKQGEST